MIINLIRRFPFYINNNSLSKNLPPIENSLKDKKIIILGKWHIGSRVGKICKILDMEVVYYKRWDNLLESTRNVDIIINTLSTNKTTKGLLNENFFLSLKTWSYFITVTWKSIYDTNAIIKSLNQGVLFGAAIDAWGIKVGDVNDSYYQKLLKHPKIFVTPHIAYNTWDTKRVANDIMIDNVQAWLDKKPINLI